MLVFLHGSQVRIRPRSPSIIRQLFQAFFPLTSLCNRLLSAVPNSRLFTDTLLTFLILHKGDQASEVLRNLMHSLDSSQLIVHYVQNSPLPQSGGHAEGTGHVITVKSYILGVNLQLSLCSYLGKPVPGTSGACGRSLYRQGGFAGRPQW